MRERIISVEKEATKLKKQTPKDNETLKALRQCHIQLMDAYELAKIVKRNSLPNENNPDFMKDLENANQALEKVQTTFKAKENLSPEHFKKYLFITDSPLQKLVTKVIDKLEEKARSFDEGSKKQDQVEEIKTQFTKTLTSIKEIKDIEEPTKELEKDIDAAINQLETAQKNLKGLSKISGKLSSLSRNFSDTFKKFKRRFFGSDVELSLEGQVKETRKVLRKNLRRIIRRKPRKLKKESPATHEQDSTATRRLG